jgi:hypothetical protein
MGVGLVIGFIGLFNTAHGYTVQFTITHTDPSVHSHVSTSRCSVAAFYGNVPLPLRSRTITCLSYQLLTAIAYND